MSNYQFTPGDMEIIAQSHVNPNIFLNYYVRGDDTGTTWAHDMIDPERAAGYNNIYKIWEAKGKPNDSFTMRFDDGDIEYMVRWRYGEELPDFFHNHGWMFLPWQLDVFNAKQTNKTIIGGFGCGKTSLIALTLLFLGATVPNFKAYVCSEQGTQALTIYEYMLQNTENTLYSERFWIKAPTKPVPHIEIACPFYAAGRRIKAAKSEVWFYSIKDNPTKLRSKEADLIAVEQAEEVKDLEAAERELGSRLRGSIRGRERLNQFYMIANAGDSYELWERFDRAERDPKKYFSLQVSYQDNPFLTERDREGLLDRAGKTVEDQEQWLHGFRPLGKGKHFSRASLEICHSKALDDAMEIARKQGMPGHVYEEADKVGIYRWELPPEPGHEYLVMADPGTQNPPFRDSCPMAAWDITFFPEVPCTLRAFHWVFGHGSIEPFFAFFTEMVEKYHAGSQCGFDATGQQKQYNEYLVRLEPGQSVIMPEPMSMAGNQKYLALNAAKSLISKGHFRWPSIERIKAQLLNYDLPDTKLRQDIVMMIALTADWLRRLDWPEDTVIIPGPVADRVPPRHSGRVDRRHEGRIR